MALVKLMLILPLCLFAIFQLIGCDEHVKKRKDSQRPGRSKFFYQLKNINFFKYVYLYSLNAICYREKDLIMFIVII